MAALPGARPALPELDGQVFEAYRPEVVVECFPRKIECICLWENFVLAGLADGSLIFLQQGGSAKAHDESKWQVPGY